MTEDELMRELEKDIDAPDMFSMDYENVKLDTRTPKQLAIYYKTQETKYNKLIDEVNYVKPINYDIRVENGYLCIGEFRIELDNRTPLQKAKSRYYFKKKSNGI
tara:strand:- start:824 stop:1135 length:312 start_codon:yes stop_codon:yes gene_type:complete